jgi:hypothetical protein
VELVSESKKDDCADVRVAACLPDRERRRDPRGEE